MKTKTSVLRRVLALAAACVTLGTLGASHARAQANLTFVGGNGTPLGLTLNAPVTYVVTTAPTSLAPRFIFQGVGNFGSYLTFGSLSYSVNGVQAGGFPDLDSGGAGANQALNDAYVNGYFNLSVSLKVGDVVVLNAGTLTTRNNFPGTLTNGSYQTYLIDVGGTKLDLINGLSGPVPEPSTWALLGVGTLGLVMVVRRGVARA